MISIITAPLPTTVLTWRVIRDFWFKNENGTGDTADAIADQFTNVCGLLSIPARVKKTHSTAGVINRVRNIVHRVKSKGKSKSSGTLCVSNRNFHLAGIS